MVNGDVYDIDQTINGVSTFVYLNQKWYYFSKQMFREYEYDMEDLTKTINNVSGLEKITYLGNIFKILENVSSNK